ncbi:MAG TPA: TOMM system kinase/cyclase fusion protein [Cytophagales bacterium]|nr:TOMM system kinase/cyclase fusion protein [Cytophagales bacterium]
MAINPANYELHDIIGEGGFGVVYRATHVPTAQIVAIKILRLNPQTTEAVRQRQRARFERETQLCAQLNHPHIVSLLDKGYTDEGNLFAVFEFVEGQSLKEMIIQSGGLTPVLAGELMGQVLDGLAHAHQMGIVHRDLKPSNIMVSKTGIKYHAKILDFGIGTFTTQFQPKDYALLTLTQEALGTPAYTAPEQLRGDPVTHRADLYAWGLIMLECLTGKQVMGGHSSGEVFDHQLNANPVPLPSTLVDHPLGAVMRKTLEKKAELRVGSAEEVAKLLASVNFQTLTGSFFLPQGIAAGVAEDITTVSDLATGHYPSQKHLITALAIQVNLEAIRPSEVDQEIIDSIQDDQLTVFKDLATRHGGYLAGSVADTMTILFGYPVKDENDARFAGRTALELMSQAQRRGALLWERHGLDLSLRMGIHSGAVVIKPQDPPKGQVSNLAFSLLNHAEPDTVLVSEDTKRLLDPYLEFEAAGRRRLLRKGKPTPLFSLKGERPSEALSFLRPASTQRQLVGREAEILHIKKAWENTLSKDGKAVLIQGPAGIGKSRLIHEIKRFLSHQDATVREIRCFPEYRNNALYPYLELFKQEAAILDLDDPSIKIKNLRDFLKKLKEDTETLVPIFCSWLAIPIDATVTGSQLPPDRQKDLLIGTLRQWLQGLSTQAPYLLVMEDLHWMDPTSLELSMKLLKDLPQHSLMVLQTARPDFEESSKLTHLSRMQLRPLDQDRTRQMILAVLDSQTVDEKLVHYISERSDGVPLFIEELTHMLLDREFLIVRDDTYHLDETRDISRIPVRLNDLLSARLDKLGSVKVTAQLAATIGREFDYALLVRSSEKSEESIQQDLETLAEADLIYKQRRVGHDGFFFRHALIREAAYEGMSRETRRYNHGRIATTLLTLFADRVTENPMRVASHLAASGRNEEAVKFGLQSLRDNLATRACEEVLRFGRKVEKWNAKIDPEALRLRNAFELYAILIPASIVTRGAASTRHLEWDRKLETVERQLVEFQNIAREFSNHPLMPIIKYSRLAKAVYAGKYDEGKALGEALRTEAEEKQDYATLSMILPGISSNLCMLGELDTALPLLNQSLHLYETNNYGSLIDTWGWDPKAQSLFMKGMIIAHRGKLNKGYRMVEEGFHWAAQIKSKYEISTSTLIKLFIGYLMHDRDLMVTAYEQSMEPTQGDLPSYPKIFMNVALDWAQKRQPSEVASIDNLLSIGQHINLTRWEPLLADNLMMCGQWDQGIARMEAALERALQIKERIGLPLIYEVLAYGYSHQEGPTDRVANFFKAGIAEATQMNAPWLGLHVAARYAEVWHQAGKAKEARQALRPYNELIALTEGNPLKTQIESITK